MDYGEAAAMKRTGILLCICLLTLLLNGCWNYREINEMQIVTGAAIDYDGDENKYLLTVEVFNPKKTEAGDQGDLLHASGESMFDCFRNLILRSGRRLYWGQADILILSEKIAKNSILSVLDVICRDAEIRDDMLVFVSQEEDARSIFTLGRQKHQDLISFHIADIMKSQESISKYREVQGWRFIQGLYTESIETTLPLIKLKQAEETLVPTVGGSAVFKGAQMVGSLDEHETMAMLWVLDELKGGLLVVPTTGDDQEDVTLEIFQSKTSRKVAQEDGEITIRLKVETMVNIAEISGTTNYMDEKKMMQLKKDGEALIRRQIEEVIHKVQKDCQVDVLGFSTLLRENMPELWREIQPQWEEVFQSLKVEVETSLQIRGSAMMSKPIKIME